MLFHFIVKIFDNPKIIQNLSQLGEQCPIKTGFKKELPRVPKKILYIFYLKKKFLIKVKEAILYYISV